MLSRLTLKPTGRVPWVLSTRSTLPTGHRPWAFSTSFVVCLLPPALEQLVLDRQVVTDAPYDEINQVLN